MAATDGTGDGLLEFLEWAGRRGELNPTTAKALASAAKRVLGVEDEGTAVVIRDLDVEGLLDRFENLHKTDYSESSMSTYRSRFRSARDMYLAWIDKRSDWKQMSAGARKANKSDAAPRVKRATNTKVADSSSPDVLPETESSASNLPVERMIPYELPLRRDLRVRLVLPEDLTTEDARRISAFVQSLAFPSGNAPLRQGES